MNIVMSTTTNKCFKYNWYTNGGNKLISYKMLKVREGRKRGGNKQQKKINQQI